MTVKKIIDIDVNDGAFKSFAALFSKYEEALKKMPAAWAGVNGQQKAAYSGLAAALLAQNEVFRKMTNEQRAQSQASRSQASNWHDISKYTKSAASHIADMTTNLLKWAALTSVFSGLVGAGGLWGIDRLAASTGAGRRSAQGLDLTLGEQRAFQTNFGRAVDADSFLSGVNEALHSAQGRAALFGAGLTPGQMNGDTAQVATQLLPQLKRIADQTDPRFYADVIKARHLDQFGIGVQDLERLHKLSPAEFASLQKQYGADVRGFGLDDETQRKWQDLSTQLGRAGTEIETVLVKGLTNLAGPIDHLSQSVVKAVESLANSPALKKWIDTAADAVEKFAGYVGSDKFQKDVSEFVTDIGILADKVVSALKMLGLIPDGKSGTATPSNVPAIAGSMAGAAAGGAVAGPVGALAGGVGGFTGGVAYEAAVAPGGPLNMRPPHDLTPFDWSKVSGGAANSNLLDMIRKLERSGDNAVSPAGAIGRYQVMPGTAKQYGYDPTRLTDPAYEATVAQAVLDDLSRKYHGNTAEILAAYNAGEAGSAAFRAHGDDPAYLPKETQDYLARAQNLPGYTPTVAIRIENNTGANVIVQTAQVAH